MVWRYSYEMWVLGITFIDCFYLYTYLSFRVQHATMQTLPNLRRILRSLLFVPVTGTSTESSSSSTPPPALAGSHQRSTPAERYPLLLHEDKIGIITFLCEICMAARIVRGHIEWGDSSLTELRKEKIEVNREKKRL
jgi:bromodomain adjacent to zinc finger domain protein 1A